MRTKKINDIIKMAKSRTDTVYSNHTTYNQCVEFLAEHVRKLYHIMTTLNEGLFLKDMTDTNGNQSYFPIVDGQASLPSDLLKISSVYIKSGDYDLPLNRVSHQSRGNGLTSTAYPVYFVQGNSLIKFTPKQSTYPVYLRYLPQPPDLTATATGTYGDGIVTSLLLTATGYGDLGNNVVVSFLNTAVAGSETVSVSGNTITVGVQTGVSTASQVFAALGLNPAATALLSASVSLNGPISAGSVQLSGAVTTISLVCNEDDYLAYALASDIALKEESSTDMLEKKKEEALKMINDFLTPLDKGSHTKVRDIETERRIGRPGIKRY